MDIPKNRVRKTVRTRSYHRSPLQQPAIPQRETTTSQWKSTLDWQELPYKSKEEHRFLCKSLWRESSR